MSRAPAAPPATANCLEPFVAPGGHAQSSAHTQLPPITVVAEPMNEFEPPFLPMSSTRIFAEPWLVMLSECSRHGDANVSVTCADGAGCASQPRRAPSARFSASCFGVSEEKSVASNSISVATLMSVRGATAATAKISVRELCDGCSCGCAHGTL